MMPRAPVTIFTFGYYGWGNHTPKLVKVVDAVEASRGFEPPMFMDIRIRRSVRAAGFSGSRFEKLLGPDRHRWMKSLGNKFIETRTGPKIQIAHPEAAEELLDLALEASNQNRRILFFCSCQWPKEGGKITCHRTTVARLLLKAALDRGTMIELVEWPGGKPRCIELPLKRETFDAVRRGRWSIPLGQRLDLAEMGSIPLWSTARLQAAGESLYRPIGPVIAKTRGWALPVYPWFEDPETPLKQYLADADECRISFGLTPARSRRA